jgi:hypothetical protein
MVGSRRFFACFGFTGKCYRIPQISAPIDTGSTSIPAAVAAIMNTEAAEAEIIKLEEEPLGYVSYGRPDNRQEQLLGGRKTVRSWRALARPPDQASC